MLIPKRHHFLPQSYLRGFIDPKRSRFVWVYEKSNGNVRSEQTKNIAVTTHYYSIEHGDGTRDPELEKCLAAIDEIGPRALNQLSNGEILDGQGRMDFAIYLAIMMIRVPRFRDWVEKVYTDLSRWQTQLIASSPRLFNEMTDYLEQVQGLDFGPDRERLRQDFLRDDYELVAHPNVSLGVFKLVEKFAPLLCSMKWTMLKAPSDYGFVTSDSPVVLDAPSRDPRDWSPVGLRHRDVEVSCPLSQSLALVATWADEPDAFEAATRNRVDDINKRTILAASRFVYAARESERLGDFVKGLARR